MRMAAAGGDDVEMDKIGEPVSWDTVAAQPAASPVAKPSHNSSPVTSQTQSRVAPSFIPPPSQMPSSTPLVASRATPIESLNPYSTKWLIKARVNAKSEMRTFSNDRGTSSVFSIDLVDESSEIRATAWREMVEKSPRWFDNLVSDTVYTCTGPGYHPV